MATFEKPVVIPVPVPKPQNTFPFVPRYPALVLFTLNVSGWLLVVPKKEIDYIFDIDDELLAELFVFSKKTGQAIKKIVSCKRIGITVIGIEVPHAHVHLIPINSVSDMNFTRPKLSFSNEELAETAEMIRMVWG